MLLYCLLYQGIHAHNVITKHDPDIKGNKGQSYIKNVGLNVFVLNAKSTTVRDTHLHWSKEIRNKDQYDIIPLKQKMLNCFLNLNI